MSSKLYNFFYKNTDFSVWNRSDSYLKKIKDFKITNLGQNQVIYTATITGSDIYTTTITQKNQTFDAKCTCPYDFSDYCKHIAALAQYIEKNQLEPALASSQIVDVEAMDNLNSKSNQTSKELITPQVQGILNILGRKENPQSWQPTNISDPKKDFLITYSLQSFLSSNGQDSYFLESQKVAKKTGKASNISFANLMKRFSSGEEIPYFTETEYNFFDEQIFTHKLYSNSYYSYYGESISRDTYNQKLSGIQLFKLFKTLIPLGRLSFGLYTPLKSFTQGFLLKLDFYPENLDQLNSRFILQARVFDQKTGQSLDLGKDDENWKLLGDDNYKFLLNLDKGEVFGLKNLESKDTLKLVLNNYFQPKYLTFEEAQTLASNLEKTEILEIPKELLPPTIAGQILAKKIFVYEQDEKLWMQLKFSYQFLPFDLNFDDPNLEIDFIDSSDKKFILTRDLDEEIKIKNGLELILSQTSSQASQRLLGEYLLEDPINFVLETIPELEQSGFEIFGQEKLKSHRYLAGKANLKLTQGIDWLDLEGEIDFGEQKLDISEIAKLINKKQRFIKIGDSFGVLPKEWLEKHSELFALAKTSEDGKLQVSKWHLALLENFDKTYNQKDKATNWQTQIKGFFDYQKFKTLKQPALQVQMRKYQLEGYSWLYFLYKNKLGGILADDMGLGKTLQTIALLNQIYICEKTIKPTLIVVPKTLLTNWQMEIAKFCPELTSQILHGNNRDYSSLALAQNEAFKVSNKKSAKDENQLPFNLFFTTYGTLLKDVEELKKIQFEAIILDESQQIKNANSLTYKAIKLLQASFRLALTGTPVENSLADLWSQFSFLNPGMLGSQTYFRENFLLPIEKHQDKKQNQKLLKLTQPFILRRLKENVAPELGQKLETTLYVQMEAKQAKLYDKIKLFYQKQISQELEIKDNKAKFTVLTGLTKLRQICCHPNLIDSGSDYSSCKLELLLEKLQEVVSENHKVLIFSQFTQMLAIIKDNLDKLGIQYTYLDGKTNNRQKVVDSFEQNSQPQVFLISLKAGGVGLNLTSADYVFLFDPWWNPATENQAVDRTHRIGQQKQVFVYKFVVKDSIEEKILKLQETKKDLVKNVLQSSENLLKTLDSKQIMELFS